MARSRHIGRRSRFPSSTKPASDLSAAASQALEAGGARRLWNESFFSAPQLKRDPLGCTIGPHARSTSAFRHLRAHRLRNPRRPLRGRLLGISESWSVLVGYHEARSLTETGSVRAPRRSASAYRIEVLCCLVRSGSCVCHRFAGARMRSVWVQPNKRLKLAGVPPSLL